MKKKMKKLKLAVSNTIAGTATQQEQLITWIPLAVIIAVVIILFGHNLK